MHIQTTSVRKKKKNISEIKKKNVKSYNKRSKHKNKTNMQQQQKKKQVNSLEDVSPYTESEMDSSSASYPKKRMASKE